MIAVKRLQSVLWVLLVTFGALSAYLVSLRVGAERNELARVRAQIVATRGDIRYLETEFGARAGMRQLERWNAEDFRYSAPTAQQYLNGEWALASLDGIQPNGPVYVAPPVMVAMVQTPADLPSAAQAAQSVPASPAVTQVASDIGIIRTAHAADAVEKLSLPKAKANTTAGASAAARKAERMAMLDAKLLDDSTLGDLSAKAARERRKGDR
ncbi:hypothetical protein BH10PSE12_BH10PSE12_06450 [soil metagenome]